MIDVRLLVLIGLSVSGCGGGFYRAADLEEFDAQSIDVRGEFRDGALYSLIVDVVSGAPEDCRFPDGATLTVNGLSGIIVAEPGPGSGCSGSSFRFLDSDATAVGGTGPDAELVMADDTGRLVNTYAGLLAAHTLVADASTVATGADLTVSWESPLEFNYYQSLDWYQGGEFLDSVSTGDPGEAGAEFTFAVDVPSGQYVLDYTILALLNCEGDVACDEIGSSVTVGGSFPIDVE